LSSTFFERQNHKILWLVSGAIQDIVAAVEWEVHRNGEGGFETPSLYIYKVGGPRQRVARSAEVIPLPCAISTIFVVIKVGGLRPRVARHVVPEAISSPSDGRQATVAS